MQKVYAIGQLNFDYGTRQKRDYFRNAMNIFFDTRNSNPEDEETLYKYLTGRPQGQPEYTAILNGKQFANRTDVTALTWILVIDKTPVYAILPQGAL